MKLITEFFKDENENDTSVQSQSLLKDSIIETPSKYQELILGNINGEAKFEKMFLEQVKVPEKIK